jgi:hypothetical protein
MASAVTQIPAAAPEIALVHFARRLGFETDCSEFHEALASGAPDFILLDVRSPAPFAEGDVSGAIDQPRR